MAKSCPKEYGYLKDGRCIKHKKAKKPEKPSLLKSAKSVLRPLAKGTKVQRRGETVGRTLAGVLTWGGSEAIMTGQKFLKGRKKKAEVQKSLAARKVKKDKIKVQKKKRTVGRKYAAK